MNRFAPGRTAAACFTAHWVREAARGHGAVDKTRTASWTDFTTHISRAMRDLIAARDWLHMIRLPPYVPELNPAERVWSHFKRGLGKSQAEVSDDVSVRLTFQWLEIVCWPRVTLCCRDPARKEHRRAKWKVGMLTDRRGASSYRAALLVGSGRLPMASVLRILRSRRAGTPGGLRTGTVLVTHCSECGAPARPHSCEELFHIVLALDHSRRPPWGALHGVTVSCFLLQHPSRLPASDRDRPWAILHLYLQEGLTAVTPLTEGTRRANSHRNRGTALPDITTGVPAFPLGLVPAAFSVTINDVAQDGTFPAAGFPERVKDWAMATVTGWGCHQ